jgi:proline iminopeptidase
MKYDLFPEIQPYAHGWMDASGSHAIYYEECGNPAGMPVVFLHGGPGSGCNPGQRRFFDPAHYRIILLDQRGCGRSLPAGCIEHNATPDLVNDIDQLRKHLNIQQWLVFGGSWGSTLALAYAAQHPQDISGLILRGIFLARPSELDWFTYSVRHFFPEPWDRLTKGLPADARQNLIRTFHEKVMGGDIAAAHAWNTYEGEIMTLLPQPAKEADDNIAMARARVQLHYLISHCFLESQPLLEQIDRFRHIPAVIIQGRYDMVCPPISAHDLHEAWPEAEYIVVPDAGHSAMEPGITSALVEATEQFKARR